MPITAEMLKQDPLLLFPRYAMGLGALQSNADIQFRARLWHDYVMNRASHSLMVLQLNNSPYNIAYQEQTAAFYPKYQSATQPVAGQTALDRYPAVCTVRH